MSIDGQARLPGESRVTLLKNAFCSLFDGTFMYKFEAFLFARSRFREEIVSELARRTRQLEETLATCSRLESQLRFLRAFDRITPSGTRIGLVSTMPRSGTWYNAYFFWFYDQLVRGREPEEIVADVRANTRLIESAIHDYSVSIGLRAFFLMHFFCPGFQNYHGEFRAAWEALSDWKSDASTNTGAWAIEPNETLLDPGQNPTVRIVYIYRNPLDQAVSFFRHTQNHVDEQLRYSCDENGNRIYFASPRDYLFRVGLDRFLKQYITFREMRDLYPENLRVLTYEGSIRDPITHFSTMLKFFGHDPSKPAVRESFEKALTLADIKSIKGIENAVGRSLGGDQQDSASRHIRDGGIGQWRQYFDSSDLDGIEARLSVFRLSLADFDLGDGDNAQSAAKGSDE